MKIKKIKVRIERIKIIEIVVTRAIRYGYNSEYINVIIGRIIFSRTKTCVSGLFISVVTKFINFAVINFIKRFEEAIIFCSLIILYVLRSRKRK